MNLRRVLQSPITWCVAAAIGLVFTVTWLFVESKTRDCQLLCGEQAKATARYVAGTGVSRNPSRPGAAACDCADGRALRPP